MFHSIRVGRSPLKILAGKKRGPIALVLLMLLALGAGSGARARVYNIGCTSNSCGVDSTPIYINIYWDSSLEQWDVDVAASSTEMQHGRVDTLFEALFHTGYFAPLNQYGVNSVDHWPSLVAGNCAPPPATIDDAPAEVANLLLCLFTGDPLAYARMLAGDFGYSPYDLLGKFSPPAFVPHAIYNVLLPPQTRPASPSADYCKEQNGGYQNGWHNIYSPFGPLDPGLIYAVPVTFVPTFGGEAAVLTGLHWCNNNISDMFMDLTHEMVEAATDTVPGSNFGWKQPFWEGGNEIGDLCEFSSAFLFGPSVVSAYYSNSTRGCITPLTHAPTIASASVCGSGAKMVFTLTGVFGPRPWDFPTGRPADHSLFIKAGIGQRWEAGNKMGLPNQDGNGGKPDEVFFGPIYWTQGQGGAADTIRIEGFDAGYGHLLASGKYARVIPGDKITVSVASPDAGQWAMRDITAPTGSAIDRFAVTPIGRSILVVGGRAQVAGVVHDGGCVVDGTTIDLSATAGSLSPPAAISDELGHFTGTYAAPTVAGVQTLTARIPSGSVPVTMSLAVPVSPDVTSVTPKIGDVAGGASATILGAGFASGATHVQVEPYGTGIPMVDAPVSGVTYGKIGLIIPKSPLPGDGDGIACIVATVNGTSSECLVYHYIVPGKPVLKFAFTSCDSGTVVAAVFAADGTPETVPVRFTAPYNAFRDASGNYVDSLSVNTGDLVIVSGIGPITATNAQSPNLTVTETYASFSPQLCPNLRVIVTGIDPRWSAFSPEQLKPMPIGPCPDPECPKGDGGIAVLWQANDVPGDVSPRVIMTGGSPAVLDSKFRVDIVGGAALRADIGAHPYAAVFGASGKTQVLFTGPAVRISDAGTSSVGSPFDESSRVNLPLPAGVAERSKYRIVHLAQAGKALAWMEQPQATLGTDGTSLTITAHETGLYALVRLAE